MISQQLKQLIKINILYVNPQQTRKQRESGKTGSALYRALIRQYVLLGGIFAFIYGGLLLTTNLVKDIGAFTNVVGLFTVIGLSQSVTTIDNVFFESKDLKDYLPLPLSQWAVYAAKFSVVGLIILPTALPVWMMFVITGIQTGRFVGVGITVGTLLFVLYYIFLFLFCSIAIFSFAQTKLYRHHQKLMTFLMTGITMIAMIGAIVVMNSASDDDSTSYKPIPGLTQLHQVVVDPTSLTSLITVAILLVAVVMMGLLLQKWLLPKVMSGANAQTRTVTRKHRQGQGMARQFIRYNLGLLGNPTLLTQSMAMTIVPIVFFGIAMFVQNRFSLANLTIKYAGVTFVVGIMGAVVTISQGSLAGVMISLDRQNLPFIKSLPIDFKSYLWLKFKLVVAIQSVILVCLAIGFAFLAKLMWFNAVTLCLGVLLGNILSSLYNYTRDWRLLDLTWTNATQLFNRGGGSVMIGFVMLGVMIAGGIVVAIYVTLLNAFSPLFINASALLLVVIASTYIVWHYVDYWKKADLTL